MIYKLFLTPSQVERLAIEIKGRKLTQHLVERCTTKKIASRTTVFVAISPETYIPSANKHRGVTEEAIALLKEEGFIFQTEDVEPVLELAEA